MKKVVGLPNSRQDLNLSHMINKSDKDENKLDDQAMHRSQSVQNFNSCSQMKQKKKQDFKDYEQQLYN